MKHVQVRPYTDPEKAARRLMEHARAFEPIQDGRIYIEKINAPFLFGGKATAAEYKAGLDYAIARSWFELHEAVLMSGSCRPGRTCSPNDLGFQCSIWN